MQSCTDIVKSIHRVIHTNHIKKYGLEKMLTGLYLQVLHEKVVITAGKSIVMDKSLLFAFASTVSTYIIILVQLKYDKIH
ncbi:gustatory and pheromone receptor 39a-like isoform X2 [Aethina tumida]|uniref:gustatory and pheromone receptor 39a-like isoform X2 n=1 Tax=Aethina tumida TaxID=116153 RepID=UPI002147223C|nr:gustatory and pheromone receptor 39a-like isoform X2 [Aethina tumida]